MSVLPGGNPGRNNELNMLLAAGLGNVDEIKRLHGLGVSINVQDAEKLTPLMRAVREGRVEAVKLLLELKADTSLMDDNGQTVVHRAIKESKAALLQLLVDGKADIATRNRQGLTPLEDAIVMSGTNTEGNRKFDILLDAGADPHCVDENGCRPVFQAAWFNSLHALRRLKEKGADFRTPALDGTNPLHMAARGDSADVVPMLLEEGCDFRQKNSLGRTARQEAAVLGSYKVAALLLPVEQKYRKELKEDFARMLDRGVGADLAAPKRAQFRRRAPVAIPKS